MKKLVILLLAFLALGFTPGAGPKIFTSDVDQFKDIKEGDIIFQTSSSGLSKAIQTATRSKYSHCGVIFKQNDALYVFEAVQPVTATPLQQWITGGNGGKFVIKRLANADKILSQATLNKMRQQGRLFMGKDYDGTFEWSDDKIYCSELVWKIYQRGAGVKVGELKKLKDFDLSNDIVKAKLKQQYGNNIPYNEPVISPVAIFDSPLLITALSNP